MREFVDSREKNTLDELWFVEHPPVFTLGQSGKMEHLLNPGDIPVIRTDRGGQVTYHGPGQLLAYVLIDLRRLKFGVRQLVTSLEKIVIDFLDDNGLQAVARRDAPGVYIEGKKICSLGLRIRRGCSFHGLSLNVDMDLEPFSRINPCGYKDLKMTQLKDYIEDCDFGKISQQLSQHLMSVLGYTEAVYLNVPTT